MRTCASETPSFTCWIEDLQDWTVLLYVSTVVSFFRFLSVHNNCNSMEGGYLDSCQSITNTVQYYCAHNIRNPQCSFGDSTRKQGLIFFQSSVVYLERSHPAITSQHWRGREDGPNLFIKRTDQQASLQVFCFRRACMQYFLHLRVPPAIIYRVPAWRLIYRLKWCLAVDYYVREYRISDLF